MKKTILVVEDEPDLAQIVAYNLAREGFRTVTASSGEQALEVLSAAHARSGAPRSDAPLTWDRGVSSDGRTLPRADPCDHVDRTGDEIDRWALRSAPTTT